MPLERTKVTVTGKIGYMTRVSAYVVQGEAPYHVSFIVNEDPKALEELMKSGKTVTIEGHYTKGPDYLFIEKIDGKVYKKMKKEFLPYYLSRAVLSAIFAILVMGLTWKAFVFAIILFGLFVLYLHSGWFLVDLSHPLTPLRRDERGRQIQRNALIAAVTVGILIYIILTQVPSLSGSPIIAGPLVLASGILTYFITQFLLFARA